MQDPSRFSLMKRILFPYNGENALSLKQCLRVVAAWALLFPLPFSLCILGATLLEGVNMQKITTNFLFAFLSGAIIFGLLSVLIVIMSNRSARIRQAWKAQNGRL
jgi:hypothetical protein